jgi:hypothetical protein
MKTLVITFVLALSALFYSQTASAANSIEQTATMASSASHAAKVIAADKAINPYVVYGPVYSMIVSWDYYGNPIYGYYQDKYYRYVNWDGSYFDEYVTTVRVR